MATQATIKHLLRQIEGASDGQHGWSISYTEHDDGSVYFEVSRNDSPLSSGSVSDLDYFEAYLNGVLAGMMLNEG